MTHRTSTFLAALFLSFTLGACVGAVEEIPDNGNDRSGTDDPTFPSPGDLLPQAPSTATNDAVVGLILGEADNDVEICSGVLISPRAVLTSATCMGPAFGKFVSFGSVVVRGGEPAAEDVVEALGGTADAFGGTADAFGSDSRFLGSSQVRIPAEFLTGPEELKHQYDIAVVFLTEDAPVAPISLNDTPSHLVPGSALHTVGIDAGVKRTLASTLGEVGARTYEHSSVARSQDGATAGSPTFIHIDGEDYLVGIQGASQSGVGTRDVRIDVHLDFIDEKLQELDRLQP